MNLTEEKQRARQAVAERLKGVNEQQRETESRSICRRILAALPPGQITVCAYMPMRTEANVVPVLEELLKRGCTIALPRTEGTSFTFRVVTSLEKLEKGPFGVREPLVDAPELTIADVEYALVPGAAFDMSGARLGRGNGGYDKWLARLHAENDTAEAWGIAFDEQIINGIPLEAHDEKMDAVITPRGITTIKEQV